MLCSWKTFFCQHAFELLLYENERNSLLELFTKISLLQPVTATWCCDPTWIGPNFGFLKMCNVNIYGVHLSFGAILGDPKFESFHVGSPHHVAVTGYT